MSISPEHFDNPNGPLVEIRRFPEDEIEFFRLELGFELEEAPVIAIIEDNYSILRDLSFLLNMGGFKTVCYQANSANFEASLLQIRSLGQEICTQVRPVTAGIIDKGLGYLDGIELTREISKYVPTILLTGEIDTRETHRVGNVFMMKPFDEHILLQTVYDLLGFRPKRSLDEIFA